MAKDKASRGEKVVTPKGRLSFPSLFTPDTSEMGNGQYCATLLFDNNDADVKAGVIVLKKAVLAVAREKLGKDVKLKDFKNPFRNGDEKAEKNPAYANTTYITAKSKYRPGVVDQKVREISNEGDVYAGCYVRASVIPFWYDTKGNKGVSFCLCNIQKVADGESFGGGRSDPSGDFDSVASEGVEDEEVEFEDDGDSLGL